MQHLLMSRCNTLKYPIAVSFIGWEFWVWEFFYYKPPYSEVNSSTIKIILAESWQDVLAWKQMFTKFEKKNHMHLESFQVFNKKAQKKKKNKADRDFQIFVALGFKHGFVVFK